MSIPCDTIRNYEYERRKSREEEEAKKKKQLRDRSRKIIKTQSEISGWKLTSISPRKYTVTKPYSKDKMELEILDNGTIKITTDKISAANHMSAENFHRLIHASVGGNVIVKQKPGTIAHTHGEHTHTHG